MIVNVKQLIKYYKKQPVLKGIDIKIDQPQIIALVGPNGAGKTTLLNCMTNLISYDDGTVQLLGKDNKDPSLFNDVSYLQDNRVLYENLTGYDHLKFVCDMQKIPLSEINKTAQKVGMDSYLKKKVKSYSLGMKQHLLLTMVIINRPKLLLLDEPLNGLDPTSAIHMRKILLELFKKGTTIIISSHNLGEIDRLTDIIYFMKDGQLLKESLHDFSANEYIITVNDIMKANVILEEAKVPVTLSTEEELVFLESQSTSLQDLIHLLNQKNIVIKEINRRKIGAERRYQELFEGNKTI